MAKAQSPLLGYNTNIRHKGKVFHIQTEDSGVLKPHVMTHLFADGGRILKSLKTSYAQLLETEDLSSQVKKLMQDQHKAMFLALREGQFDEVAGLNVAPTPDPVESDIPTGETNTVPPAAPTPLSPNAAVVVLPPPPPRSNLPPAPSNPPAQIPVVVARPAMFGEVSISERSLDEVILAFLAEELEASRAG
ncbi:MAG: hypothetical protein EPO40_38355 [Myxococcaceae bacterium]|nr:MAG: hypothetical protein EPO40_38355 [Myxococcaceae bacterium]